MNHPNLSEKRAHPPGCVCRACANLWDEIEAGLYDEPDVDVCTNCGGYFEWRKGLLGQRCEKCSAR